MTTIGINFFKNIKRKSARRGTTAKSIIQKALCTIESDELIFEIDKEKKREKEDKTNRSHTKEMVYLYFILNKAHNAVKIGISVDPKGRFQTFQSFNLDKLELLGYANFNSNSKKIERELHDALKKSRIRNEWFNYDSAVRTAVEVLLEL